MFVGYPANREEDSVRMWNEKTNGVVTTRDVIWMKQMFYEKAEFSETMGDGKLVHSKTEAEEEDSITSAKDEESGDEKPVIRYLEDSNGELEAGQTIDHVASDSRQLRARAAIRVPQ